MTLCAVDGVDGWMMARMNATKKTVKKCDGSGFSTFFLSSSSLVGICKKMELAQEINTRAGSLLLKSRWWVDYSVPI